MSFYAATGILAFLMVLLSPFLAQSQETDRAMRRPSGEKRTALVIGNAAYKNASPLKNAVNDAEDMASVLERKGFEVMLRKNIGGPEMENSIREFGKSLQQGGVGLFFYAGHGVQVNGANYLIPVDADIQEETDVRWKAVDANYVLQRMDQAGNPLNIVVLDACRVNPFGTRFRSASRGLAQMEAPSGSLVVYATSPGRVAEDGKGRNGTFTKHLLSKMETPGLEVREMLSLIRAEVERETENKQTPWELSSLKGKFFFTPAPQTPSAKPAPNGPSTGIEPEAWEMVKDSERPGDIKDFLSLFPDGPHVALARLRLKMLEREQISEPKAEREAARLPVDDTEALYRQGMEHLDRKSYKEAIELLTRAAEKGHMGSQNELGYIYGHGLGVKKSSKESAKWYRRAAEQGLAAAQNNLGVMYIKGEGVRKSHQAALEWFERAAKQADPSGQFHLATMYRKGIGVKADEATALEWYKKAAEQGHEQAKEAVKSVEKGGN